VTRIVSTRARGDDGVPPRPYATVAAFERALRAKLNARTVPGRTYQDLRKLLAFDRILARLSAVAPDEWRLKGGVALEYRLDRARSTTDIDVSAHVDFETMVEGLRAAARMNLKDYFSLRLGETGTSFAENAMYRFHVDVLFENGRLFEPLKIDIGFADPWLGSVQTLRGPPLLDFAGIEPATVNAISIEQHLAEKLHAYTRHYGGHESTRVKDLVDMALLVGVVTPDSDALARTLHEVFSARRTHNVPAVLPAPPESWRAEYARLAANLAIPQTSDEAYRYVADALARAIDVATTAFDW
jgi:hypothetical protein